ncbi:hypothetical protein QWJ26_38895 [Streptomyces sp. CSDS2]|uniref:hypothetical protein n=1 Tax=Streptomyces sp. CSDS2 TaxID=3055051 RepID=UPI0025AEF2F0|nr:hypothetical protein [Streptomyces sp. CSDS2]MDN3265669.1 hypothetical protein [Streptomyces sp. CSDS2]
MRNMIKVLTVGAAIASVAALPGTTSASAAVDPVMKTSCGTYRLPDDHACLMARRGRQVNGWRVTVNLHAQQRHGHDWVFGAAWVGTGGRVWIERKHRGHTQILGRKTSLGDGAVSMGIDGAVYDGPGYKARACADIKGGRLQACTDWY